MSRTWWFFILVIILIGAAMRYQVLLLVAFLLILIGGASHLWARYCLAGVSYSRRFSSTRLFYGEQMELTLEMVNAKPLPLPWLIIVDEVPNALELLTGHVYASANARRRLLINSLSLRWYERVTRRYHLRSVRRGAWELGPALISSGDIFGFAIQRQSLERLQTIVIYPRMVPITALGLPDMHPFGDFKTPRQVIADPLRLLGAREYVSGDSFRHIHWKATARRQGLQTKVFEPSADRPLALFLNVRTSRFANEGIDRDILELAVAATASIARWGWEHGYAVGLYVNSVTRPGNERIRLRPTTDPDQLIHILEALAWMEDDGLWTIATILKLEAADLPYGATVVLVTPLVNNRLYNTLIDLRRREHGVALVALGEAELEPELPGVKQYHIGGREVWHELEALELA